MNRPPIVTVMGHVDHGKTTLLDTLRNSNVVGTESGGITQHTGASQIIFESKKITFIDTPGHEAFSEMRSRGGKIADIAILVVAANDGVKPQTKEALSHIKVAGIPLIVAITKMDLPNINIARVKKQIFDEGLVLEEFGGDVMCVEVSAAKKTNLDILLKSIIALSEIIETPDSDKDNLEAYVLESNHNSKKGFVANIVLTKGILTVGDVISIGRGESFKVKSILDFEKKPIKKVLAGDPCEILGLKNLATSGDVVKHSNSEALIIEEELPSESVQQGAPTITEAGLNVILRADTFGTLEAIKASITKISFEGKRVRLLLADCGEVKESDVNLAKASNSIIIAFKAIIPQRVKDKADVAKVLIREYDVIYNLVEEISGALEGIFEIEEEKIKGRAEILKLYPLPSGDIIAGCKVSHGRLRANDSVSIFDPQVNEEVFKTKIKNLKKGLQKADIVGKNTECGVLFLSGFEKLKEGLIINVI